MVKRGSEAIQLEAYQDMVSYWQNQAYEPLQVDYWYYMKFNPALSSFLKHSPCASWILDLRTQQFDFVSENTWQILGYDASLFKEKGLEFCNQIKHPDDLGRTWKLLKQVWEKLISIPPQERVHYKFNYDYRILKPGGEEVRILEHCSVLQQDGKGHITHILGMCNNITGWKNSDKQVASITSSLDGSITFLTPNNSSENLCQTNLSKREIEIAKLLAQGLSSKCIAEKLFISVHTVNTHRQNMMDKTGCKNTGELVNFVISFGLI